VLFRVIEGERAILARTPDLLELAGSVAVPAQVRDELVRAIAAFPAAAVADESCSCAGSRSTSSTGSTSPTPTWRHAPSCQA
jgi:hypothetical protein